jgi:hypothetical protein
MGGGVCATTTLADNTKTGRKFRASMTSSLSGVQP